MYTDICINLYFWVWLLVEEACYEDTAVLPLLKIMDGQLGLTNMDYEKFKN